MACGISAFAIGTFGHLRTEPFSKVGRHAVLFPCCLGAKSGEAQPSSSNVMAESAFQGQRDGRRCRLGST